MGVDELKYRLVRAPGELRSVADIDLVYTLNRKQTRTESRFSAAPLPRTPSDAPSRGHVDGIDPARLHEGRLVPPSLSRRFAGPCSRLFT